MWTKVKTWFLDLPVVGKIAVGMLVVAVMFAISHYNGVQF